MLRIQGRAGLCILVAGLIAGSAHQRVQADEPSQPGLIRISDSSLVKGIERSASHWGTTHRYQPSSCSSNDNTRRFGLLGYFIPTGCCGHGCYPIGFYNRLYPANPSYFDSRDGRVYSAQGYGTPMVVPLAPVVGHTYNYGWGVPSSRLTPVSHPPTAKTWGAYRSW